MKIELIAHRGDTINYPENTTLAFQSALDKGADGFECDIHFHQGKLIIVHDYLFDKKKKYPILKDALAKFLDKKDIRIEIEIKSFSLSFLPLLAKELSEIKAGDKDRLEITSSVWPTIPYIRQALPDISLGVIFLDYYFEKWMKPFLIREMVAQTMLNLKADVAHLSWDIIDRELIDSLHKNGIRTATHIYRKPMKEQINQYKKMTDLGVDQCTFDDIKLLSRLHVQ